MIEVPVVIFSGQPLWSEVPSPLPLCPTVEYRKTKNLKCMLAKNVQITKCNI